MGFLWFAFILVLVLLLLSGLYMLSLMAKRKPKAGFHGKLGEYHYAHRGLHSIAAGIPENSLTAFRLAAQHDYGAELDERQTAALEESLRRLGRIMREDPKGLQYSEMLTGAEEVARELVQNARELVNDDEYQDYRDLRKWLRGQKLTISRADAAGIADFNDHCLACVGPLSF